MPVFFAECFVESIPQTHLSWILMIMVSGTAPGGRGLVRLSGDSAGKIALFYLSFTTSVISASLGMSQLLLNGPSKFIRKTGRLGGYCQWGFVLLILSIMSGIVSKAAWLEIVVTDPFNMGPLGAVMWIGVSLLPQLLLVQVIVSMDQICHFKTKTIFVSGPFFAHISLRMQKSNDHLDSLAVLCTSPYVFHLYFWGQNRSVTKVFGAFHQLDLGELLPNFVWNHFRGNICLPENTILLSLLCIIIKNLFPPYFCYPLHIFMPTVCEGMLLLYI